MDLASVSPQDEALVEFRVVMVFVSRHVIRLVVEVFECLSRLFGTLLLIFQRKQVSRSLSQIGPEDRPNASADL